MTGLHMPEFGPVGVLQTGKMKGFWFVLWLSNTIRPFHKLTLALLRTTLNNIIQSESCPHPLAVCAPVGSKIPGCERIAMRPW